LAMVWIRSIRVVPFIPAWWMSALTTKSKSYPPAGSSRNPH